MDFGVDSSGDVSACSDCCCWMNLLRGAFSRVYIDDRRRDEWVEA